MSTNHGWNDPRMLSWIFMPASGLLCINGSQRSLEYVVFSISAGYVHF